MIGIAGGILLSLLFLVCLPLIIQLGVFECMLGLFLGAIWLAGEYPLWALFLLILAVACYCTNKQGVKDEA